MDCNEAQQNISAFIRKDLKTPQLGKFLKHMENCPSCRDELEVSFIIQSALEQLDQDTSRTYNMEELYGRQMQEAEKKVRRFGFVKSYKVILAVLAGLLVLFGIGLGLEKLVTEDQESALLVRTILERNTKEEKETERYSLPQEALFSGEISAAAVRENVEKVISVPETEWIEEKMMDPYHILDP